MVLVEISEDSMKEINDVMKKHPELKNIDDVILWWVYSLDGFVHGSL